MRNRTFLATAIVIVCCTVLFSGSASHSAEKVLKVALVGSESSPEGIGARWLKNEIESKTNGDIKVEVYVGGVLGGEIQMLQKLQLGTIQACYLTEHAVGNVVPLTRIFLLPFTMMNHWVAHRMYDTDFAHKMWQGLDGKGIVYNGMWCTGFRGFHTSKRIIHGPEDVKDLKMRVPEAPEFITVMEAMGVNATPISWSEIYTALSQKIVDGTDTTQYWSWNQKIYEVAPYITILKQNPIGLGFWWNKKWLESLSKDHQKICRDAAWQMADWQRQYQEVVDVYYDDRLRSAGATIYYPTEEERAVFKEMTKDVPKKFYDKYGKENVIEYLKLSDQITEEVKGKMVPNKWGIRRLE